MTKKYQSTETNKLYYGKFKTKVKFHSSLSSEIWNNKHNNNLDDLLKVLNNRLKKHNKSGEYKIIPNNSRWNLSKREYRLSRKELENTAKAIELTISEDKNTVSFGYYRDHFVVYTNMTLEWTDLLEKADDSRNKIWTISKEAQALYNQNEKICVVNKPPEYEFKIYMKSGRPDSKMVDFFKSNKKGFKIGPIALENIGYGYYTNGNYFYAKNRKYLTLVQMSYPNMIRRVDRMVYKYADKVQF